MSVYTTKDITREEAEEEVKKQLEFMINNLGNTTDEYLEKLMFDFFGDERLESSRLENYQIT